MGVDAMDGAITENSVTARSVVIDDQGDYPKLYDIRLSQVELQRARSDVDVAVPWLLWPVFVISVVVGGSSAAVIKAMTRAAPVSLACWRHQVSAIAMLPFFVVAWRNLSKSERAKVLSIQSLGLYFISALGLAGNLGFYLWSLDHTSMIHCLFLVCMPPIFVAIYTMLVGGVLMAGEMIGVGFGLVGVAVLAAGTKLEKNNESTHVGDFVALLAAASMAVYLIVGKKLRSWMPLFVYQFPVVIFAMIILGTAGLVLEGWNESEVGDISGPFGWLRKVDVVGVLALAFGVLTVVVSFLVLTTEYILGAIYLGIGPGFVGNAGYSFVLRYSSPLVMPAGLSMQPIIGSTLGWAFGESPLPGLWTCLGGAVTLAGTLFVSCASAKKKAAEEETNDEEYKQPAMDDEEGQQGRKPLLQHSELP